MKVIRLTTCLLLATAALAQHYAAPGAPSAVPMDFNDDIYNRDMRVQPSSNFIFNFEQARRDQPPQVEVREENLGKYMGRPRTTTPLPTRPRFREQQVPDIDTVHLHHITDQAVTMKPYVPQQWDPISSHLPATIPPAPTTPRWMDLSDDSFKHHTQYKPRYPVNGYEHVPTQTSVPQWTQPAPMSIDSRLHQQEASYTNMMPHYASPSPMPSMPVEQYAQEPVRTRASNRSRGSHKFNWNDVNGPESAPVVPSTPAPVPAAGAPLNRGPPPSIPTLSPWYGDGFGK